jgi:hypothetical protein
MLNKICLVEKSSKGVFITFETMMDVEIGDFFECKNEEKKYYFKAIKTETSNKSTIKVVSEFIEVHNKYDISFGFDLGIKNAIDLFVYKPKKDFNREKRIAYNL